MRLRVGGRNEAVHRRCHQASLITCPLLTTLLGSALIAWNAFLPLSFGRYSATHRGMSVQSQGKRFDSRMQRRAASVQLVFQGETSDERRILPALRAIRMVRQQGETPSGAEYSSAIAECAQHSMWGLALELIGQMRNDGIRPDVAVYGAVANACKQEGQNAKNACGAAPEMLRELLDGMANAILQGSTPPARLESVEKDAAGKYIAHWKSPDNVLHGLAVQLNSTCAGLEALTLDASRPLIVAAALISERRMDRPPPPPAPRPPRERKMTEVEKQADAIVHAVVAVELLSWHGKLGGTLETAFRKCVYTPVIPRLRRLTSRKLSSGDFRLTDGMIRSRPSRVHDSQLEKQFTLGNVFTSEALMELERAHQAKWFPEAQYRSRQELWLAQTGEPDDDPAAKDLVAWSQGHVTFDDGKEQPVRDRAVGHGDATPCIWILPVFVDHDRSAHAERQVLLSMLENVPKNKDEGVMPTIKGQVRVYASHTPCISCLSSMMQFSRAFENGNIKVTFDVWKETRRWIGRLKPGQQQTAYDATGIVDVVEDESVVDVVDEAEEEE